MFGFLKEMFKDKRVTRLKEKAIMEMTNFLMNYGFSFEEAVKVAKEFWSKHEKKLKELI